jgi:hypothetical protein
MGWIAKNPEPRSELKKSPENYLWQAVIWRCLRDCVSEDPKIRADAHAWVHSNTRDFHQVCDLADFLSEHVTRAEKVLYDLGCVRGKKWLTKSREKTR